MWESIYELVEIPPFKIHHSQKNNSKLHQNGPVKILMANKLVKYKYVASDEVDYLDEVNLTM